MLLTGFTHTDTSLHGLISCAQVSNAIVDRGKPNIQLHSSGDSTGACPKIGSSLRTSSLNASTSRGPSQEIARIDARGEGDSNTSREGTKRSGPNKRLPSGRSRTTVFPPVKDHPPVFRPQAGLLGLSGRPIEISFLWPTVMVPAHWDQVQITIIAHLKQENSSKPPFEEYQSREARAEPNIPPQQGRSWAIPRH